MFVYPKAGHRPALEIFFSLPQEEEKMKQTLNTLNILSVNVQIIYIYMYHFHTSDQRLRLLYINDIPQQTVVYN